MNIRCTLGALALLLLPLARPGNAALLMDTQVTVNLPGKSGYLTLFQSTHQLPGTTDTGPIGTGDGDGCPAMLGPGYVCGRGYAHAAFETYLAGTQPQPLPIAVLTLGAQATLHVHDAPSASKFSIDAQASANMPFACNASSPGTFRTLIFNFRFDASGSADPAPAGISPFFAGFTNAPNFCVSGVPCYSTASLPCDGTVTTQTIRLEPFVFLQNAGAGTGWSFDADLDASHTMTVESVDVVDDQMQPVPGARAWLADANGQPAGYFLRSEEVGVVQPVTPTPTATPGPGATVTPTPTPTATPGGSCNSFSVAKLTVGKMLAPGGDDSLAFGGTLALAGTPRDPELGGLGFRLADGAATVVDVTLPAGLYDKATKRGWKVNAKRTKWTWAHPKAGAPAGIVKAVLATKKTNSVLTIKGTNGMFAAAPPVRVTTSFPQNGECTTTAFDAPAQSCVVKSKGKKLVCK